MKIGIDVSQIVYQTGVSDYTINLVSSLAKQLSPQELVLFGSSFRQKQTIKSVFPATRLYSLPPTVLHLLWNVFHVSNIESFTGQLDVFHSSDWAEPPSVCPKITTLHDLSPLLFPQEMNNGGLFSIPRVHSSKLHWVKQESAKIICVSHQTAQDAIKLLKIPSQKITVIPEALPARFDINPNIQLAKALMSKYNLEDFIIAIGTQQPRKNIPRLISAYQKYKHLYHLPEKLVIVGKPGWGYPQLASVNDVVFTGFLPDAELVAMLSRAQALVFPSLYEGFGLPVLLAFRHQVPVVTSNLSSLPEIVGKAGIMVDPYSEEGIAAGILQAIKRKPLLVKQGLQQLSKYSWEKTAAQTIDIYKTVC